MKSFLILVFCFFKLSLIAQQDSITRFENDRFKIAYPLHWRLDTSKAMGIEFTILAPPENNSDKFFENLNLVIQDVGENIDLDKYVQLSEQQLNTLATDVKILESKRIKNNQFEFHKEVFEMTQGTLRLKLEQYYFIRNNRAYVLTLTTESPKFDNFKSVGEKILNSFRILE